MGYVFTDANFEAEVLNSDIPVMVDFYADWCGPCKMMAPIVEELAAEYEGKVKIGKLNAEENPETAQKYGIMAIPNFICFKGGEIAVQKVGGMVKKDFVQMLDGLL